MAKKKPVPKAAKRLKKTDVMPYVGFMQVGQAGHDQAWTKIMDSASTADGRAICAGLMLVAEQLDQMRKNGLTVEVRET